MSEQTPTSTEELSGAEPSMEDILASIRKIISEDEPVAMESPEDVTPVELVSAEAPVLAGDPLSNFGESATDLTSDAVTDFSNGEASLGADQGGIVDLNIDDVLAGLDDDMDGLGSSAAEGLQIPEVPTDASEDFSIENLMSDLDTSEAVPDVSLGSNDSSLESKDGVFAFLDSKAAAAAGAAGAAVAGTVGALSAGQSQDLSERSEVSELMESVGIDSDVSSTAENLLPEIDGDVVEMDALLDDILLAPEDPVEEFSSEDVLSDEILDEMALEPEILSEAEQSDLDLVKSLMAELADDPSYEETDDLDALLDMDGAADVDVEDATVEAVETVEDLSEFAADAEGDDILGDILDMSLEDELQGQADDLALADLELENSELGDLDLGDLASLDDVAAAEQENLLENLLEDTVPTEAADDTVTELPSLTEIAAAAQADAAAVESSAATQAVAGGLGLTAAGAGLAAFAANVADGPIDELEAEIQASHAETTDIELTEVDTPVVETSAPEITTETQTKPFSNQETSMPVKAVKTDTIIDEVTETAAIGAFAELNQVVEDKAIFNERGPRIGDLVQDALRPMLKEWLDANLKGIVERAVTKEVKRISKGQ